MDVHWAMNLVRVSTWITFLLVPALEGPPLDSSWTLEVCASLLISRLMSYMWHLDSSDQEMIVDTMYASISKL